MGMDACHRYPASPSLALGLAVLAAACSRSRCNSTAACARGWVGGRLGTERKGSAWGRRRAKQEGRGSANGRQGRAGRGASGNKIQGRRVGQRQERQQGRASRGEGSAPRNAAEWGIRLTLQANASTGWGCTLPDGTTPQGPARLNLSQHGRYNNPTPDPSSSLYPSPPTQTHARTRIQAVQLCMRPHAQAHLARNLERLCALASLLCLCVRIEEDGPRPCLNELASGHAVCGRLVGAFEQEHDAVAELRLFELRLHLLARRVNRELLARAQHHGADPRVGQAAVAVWLQPCLGASGRRE
eukprot:56164-Chlamydomonas_euryale.AAC.17